MLTIPDLDKIRMKVNALDYVIKKIISMEYINRCQRLVIYLSKSLNKIEKNYKIYNKKMLINRKNG